MRPERVAIIGSPDYLDRDYIVRYIQSLTSGTNVVTGDGAGTDELVTMTAGGLKMQVRAYCAPCNIVGNADRVVIFYERGQDFDRLKSVRSYATEENKPVELYMVGSDGQSKLIVTQSKHADPPPPILTEIIPDIPVRVESDNPARRAAMDIVTNLPGYQKGIKTRQ